VRQNSVTNSVGICLSGKSHDFVISIAQGYQLGFGATVCSAAGCLAMIVLYVGMFLRARKTGVIS